MIAGTLRAILGPLRQKVQFFQKLFLIISKHDQSQLQPPARFWRQLTNKAGVAAALFSSVVF